MRKAWHQTCHQEYEQQQLLILVRYIHEAQNVFDVATRHWVWLCLLVPVSPKENRSIVYDIPSLGSDADCTPFLITQVVPQCAVVFSHAIMELVLASIERCFAK